MARPTIRRSVIVGLGGTGALTVLNIKKALYQFYGTTPLSVRFLVLDTDPRLPEDARVFLREGRWEFIEIGKKEFLYLPVRDPLEAIRSSEPIKRWWSEGLPTRACTAGAGAYRALGRLALHCHAREVKEAFEKTVSDVKDIKLAEQMRNKQNLSLVERAGVDVYIIGSLAGGTGSGAFLDIGFLFKRILPGAEHKISGFFFLPSVFKGLPATHRITSNTYAALKELDYYMDFNYMRSQPPFMFGAETFNVDRPPYDVIVLVDSRNENGAPIKGSGSFEGIKNLCELVGQGISLNIGNVGSQAESALDNVYGYVAAQRAEEWGGKTPHYSSFGTSVIVYPIEKLFNKIYSCYCYLLVRQIINAVRGKVYLNEEEIEKDITHFFTDNRLLEENNNILDDLFDPSKIALMALPDGIDSASALKDYADNQWKDLESIIKNELDKNLTQKMAQTQKTIEDTLREREISKGPVYSLRFGEKIHSKMEGYRKKRLDEIREREEELKNIKEDADAFFRNNIQRMSWKYRLRKKKLYEEYLQKISYITEVFMEIERRRKAIQVCDELIKTVKKYIEGLSLENIEKTLSIVRRKVETEYFGTTLERIVFGEHAIIVFPKTIFTSQGEREKHEKIFMCSEEDFKNIDIPVDFKDFLKHTGIIFEDLGKMDPRDLKEKLVSYAQERVKAIKDTTVEDVLLKDIKRDEEKREKLDFWLKEASNRATPFWYHKAVGDMAARMEEIFIIGVGDTERTAFTKMEYPEARYEPTFTSTQDPYKIFYFKFKTPLPAYKLENAKDYRRDYLQMPISHTPHIEKEIELKIPDIFPITLKDKLWLRVYAISLALSVLKKDEFSNTHYIDDKRFLEPGEERIELADSYWGAYEEFKEDRRKDLREKIRQATEEEIKKNPEKVMESLKEYFGKIKDRFTKRDENMPIGDEILIWEQIRFLDEFFDKGEAIQNFFKIE